MTLEAVASRQIQASQQILVKPKVLAGYMLEDSSLLLDKQSIEPLLESRFAINSASAIVTKEALTNVSMSNTFCTITSKHLEEEIRKTIGRSPDLVSDIVRPITRVIEDMIEFIIKPMGAIVDRIKRMVYDAAVLMQNKIAGAITTIKSGVTTVIKTSQGVITTAVDAVKKQVKGLLDGVIDLINEIGLVLEKIFDKLGNVFKGLLSMEPADILSLQMELAKLAGEQMIKAAKSG